MAQQAADHCTNPSEEVIRVGHLTVHFLVPGENSSGTAAVFEIVVPAGQRLIAPAHSHDHYEETIYGIEDVDRGRQADRPGTGAGALHSAVLRSPVRQQRYRRREGTDRRYTRGDRPAVLPRVCRSDQRGGRWSAGPGKDGGDYAPPRVDSGSASASDLGRRPVKASDHRRFRRR